MVKLNETSCNVNNRQKTFEIISTTVLTSSSNVVAFCVLLHTRQSVSAFITTLSALRQGWTSSLRCFRAITL